MAFGSAYATDGATFPAAAQRLANSALAPGKSGIIGVSDLLVRGLGAAGVAVDPGAAIIANTYPLTAFRQSYLVANESADGDAVLPVPAAGSGSARTDYLILRIYDAQYAGQTDPTGKGAGLVLVSALPTTYPYVALAKIVQPAGNTAGIQQNMITDLRKVANPSLDSQTFFLPATAQDAGVALTSTATTGEIFPGPRLAIQTLTIPKDATRIRIECTMEGVQYPTGANPFGRFWVEWGDTIDASVKEISTDTWRFDSPSGNVMRTNWIMAAEQTIPYKYRGTTTQMWFKARYDSTGANATGVRLDAFGGAKWKIEYLGLTDSEVR